MFSAAILAGLFHLVSADAPSVPGIIYVKVGNQYLKNVANVGITLSDTPGTIYASSWGAGGSLVLQDTGIPGTPYYLATDGSRAVESTTPTLWASFSSAVSFPEPAGSGWLCDGPTGACICNSTYGIAPLQVKKDCNPANILYVYA